MFPADNEMDGESLEALLGTSQGPDCLKELITKLGIRLKVWQRIKTLMVYSQAPLVSQIGQYVCIVSSVKPEYVEVCFAMVIIIFSIRMLMDSRKMI